MKIHHTNRTMNATFNLKRFLLLEQYKRNETGRHLLWSAAVVSFICILCILYDINRGGSYYGKHTSATEFSRYVLWFILIAPCLLETNFSKRNSTLDILLPASAFEKFLHIWIKYLLLLPLFCGLLIACLKGLLSLSGSEFLQYFATHITMWPVALSGRLLIVALVGRYPANWLIRRESILYHLSFSHCSMRNCALMRY